MRERGDALGLNEKTATRQTRVAVRCSNKSYSEMAKSLQPFQS